MLQTHDYNLIDNIPFEVIWPAGLALLKRNAIFPQTVLALMGFRRLGKDIHESAGSSVAPVARQLLCTGCGLGEGQVAPVHAKRSLAPLSTEKRRCFGTFWRQSDFWLPGLPQPPKRLPQSSPDARELLRCPPQIIIWGLSLGSF